MWYVMKLRAQLDDTQIGILSPYKLQVGLRLSKKLAINRI